MRIVLWCDREFADDLSAIFPDDLQVVCIIDADCEDESKTINGIPLISFDQFRRKYLYSVEAAFVCMNHGLQRMEAVRLLQYYGISNIGFPKLHRSFDVSHEGMVWTEGKPYLSQVEIHIMDSCNLNCVGCTHFSNLFDRNEVYDFNQFSADLRMLSNRVLFSILYLLGGEPFLNPNLVDYLYAARAILPDCDIVLVTNGLLIPQQSDEVIDALRRTGIFVEISLYPPTAAIVEKIQERLSGTGVGCCIRAERQEFMAFLGTEGTSDPLISQQVCGNAFCRYVRNGKLYKCPVDALSYKYQEKFHVNRPESQGIDLYAYDFERMLPLLDEPIQLCRYCKENIRVFPWKAAKHPAKEDWFGLADEV